MFTRDRGEAGGAGDERGGLRVVRIGGGVAGVLDDGRERSVRHRLAERRADHRGEQGPVARLDVLESIGERLPPVERGVGDVLEREDRQRRARARRRLAHDVAGARREVAEDQAAEAVGRSLADLATVAILEGECAARGGVEHGGELYAALHAEHGLRRGGEAREHQDGEDGGTSADRHLDTPCDGPTWLPGPGSLRQ